MYVFPPSYVELLFPGFKIDMETWILKWKNINENLLIAVNLMLTNIG